MNASIFKRNLKARLIALVVCVAAYVVMWSLSANALNDIYVFKWMARHSSYIFGAVIAVLLIFFDKSLIAYFSTFGTACGSVVGQYLGDHLRAKNVALITPDMSAQQQHLMSEHNGVFIMWGVWFGFLVLGVILNVIIGFKKKRKAKTAVTREH